MLYQHGKVALRKESVDRNYNGLCKVGVHRKSLSARRAWIEIIVFVGGIAIGVGVALRKESVDRNALSDSL